MKAGASALTLPLFGPASCSRTYSSVYIPPWASPTSWSPSAPVAVRWSPSDFAAHFHAGGHVWALSSSHFSFHLGTTTDLLCIPFFLPSDPSQDMLLLQEILSRNIANAAALSLYRCAKHGEGNATEKPPSLGWEPLKEMTSASQYLAPSEPSIRVCQIKVFSSRFSGFRWVGQEEGGPGKTDFMFLK